MIEVEGQIPELLPDQEQGQGSDDGESQPDNIAPPGSGATGGNGGEEGAPPPLPSITYTCWTTGCMDRHVPELCPASTILVEANKCILGNGRTGTNAKCCTEEY